MSEKRRFLAENGYYVTGPTGNSMRPFIIGGRDVLTVIPLDDEPKKYDVVLYVRQNGEHVIHRIVGKRKDFYLLRGDNCYYTERVPKEALIGLADRVLRGEKEILIRTDRSHRVAVALWCGLYPLRYLLSLPRLAVSRLRRNALGRKNKNEKRV